MTTFANDDDSGLCMMAAHAFMHMCSARHDNHDDVVDKNNDNDDYDNADDDDEDVF